MFPIFLNDTVDCVVNNRVLLYADDLNIFREINEVNDCHLLREDLDRLVAWSNDGLKCHMDKLFVISYTKRTKNIIKFKYFFNRVCLQCRSKITYLVVTMDSKCSCTDKISESYRSAYRTLYFQIRQFLNRIFALKLGLFSLVRSRLEFGAVVWHPPHAYLIDVIEQIQIKFILYLFF